MNKLNPRKLLNSKWTALRPIKKQKHFIVSDIEFDELGHVLSCSLEAVMSRQAVLIDWRDLQDDKHWLQGWK